MPLSEEDKKRIQEEEEYRLKIRKDLDTKGQVQSSDKKSVEKKSYSISFRWIFIAIFLLIPLGLENYSLWIFALLLVPAVRKKIFSIFPQLRPLLNEYLLAVVFLLVVPNVVRLVEENSKESAVALQEQIRANARLEIVNDYNSNKDAIEKQIAEHRSNNDFSAALEIANKYSDIIHEMREIKNELSDLVQKQQEFEQSEKLLPELQLDFKNKDFAKVLKLGLPLKGLNKELDQVVEKSRQARIAELKGQLKQVSSTDYRKRKSILDDLILLEPSDVASLRSTNDQINEILRSQLLLHDWGWSEVHNFAIAEGQVENLTNAPLDNIQAVVSISDKDGNFIAAGDALVEYRPLLPNQKSPFKVYVNWNPRMEKAQIEFKTLFGGTLSFAKKP